TLFDQNMSSLRVPTRDGFIDLDEYCIQCSKTLQTLLTNARPIFINFPTSVIRNVFNWCNYHPQEIEFFDITGMFDFNPIGERDFILLQIHSSSDAAEIFECASTIKVDLNSNVPERFLLIHCQLTSLI
ncbi:hypothetical protein BLOT_012865, partial [Blomia tropicalis]